MKDLSENVKVFTLLPPQATDALTGNDALSLGSYYMQGGLVIVHGFGTGAVSSDPVVNLSNGQTITLESDNLATDQEVIAVAPLEAYGNDLSLSSITNGDAQLNLGVTVVLGEEDTSQAENTYTSYYDHS